MPLRQSFVLFRHDARIALHRHGQADDETGAVLGIFAVADGDLALMPLHDRTGDGEAEAAMLALSLIHIWTLPTKLEV